MQGNGVTVMLVAFYNKKALGVRYLETALKRAGYRVVTVFYKDFNSIRPKKTTEQELALLREQIEKENPILIGLSVMSSMYSDYGTARDGYCDKEFYNSGRLRGRVCNHVSGTAH